MPTSTISPSPTERPRPRESNKSTTNGPSRAWQTSPAVFLAVILAAQLMVVLDATIVNVALPHMQRSLHFTGTGLSWVINAYLLTFGGLLLLGARSGDLLGRRRTFLAGIALFSVSSLVGGFAVSSWMLLAARSFQGVGAAFAAPSSLALLTAVFADGPARTRAIALFTTVSAAGGAIGLIAGGVLTELVSWRGVMFVNVPIGLAVLLVGHVVVRETPVRHGRFDVAGAVASTLGMASVVLGLVEAGSRGWSSPATFASLAAGVILLALFGLIETRAEEPIVPLRLLANRTRSAANVSRGLVYAGMYGSFFFLGQFLQDADRYSPLRAGLSFLPIPLSVFLSSQIVSRVLVARVRPKALMLSGMSLALVAMVLMSRLQAGTTYPYILGSLILLGLGTGSSLVALTAASLAGVAPEDAGAASGLVNVIQQVGAALGVAILVTVFSSASGHAQLAAGRLQVAALVHGLDTTFAVGALFGFVALAMVAALVRLPAPARSSAAVRDLEREWIEDDRVGALEREVA